MTTTNPPTLHVNGPADLVTAVPFLLGFHPRESLVIIGLHDRAIVATARLDLTNLATSSVLIDTLTAIKHGNATATVGAVFNETMPRPNSVVTAQPIATQFAAGAKATGLELVDTLLVTRGRWWSLGCAEEQCCPAEGTPLPTTPTAFTAAATYAGLTALPDREALAEMFTPLPERPDLAERLEHHHYEQLSKALNGRQTTYDRSLIRALFAVQRTAQAGRMPSDDDVARYGVGLHSYSVRDAVWLAVDDSRLAGIEVWVNLARRLPSPYAAAPLFLAAWTAYRDGNGALAGIAANLALTSDPGYSAADLLLAALARGVDPRTLPRLRASSKGGTTPATA